MELIIQLILHLLYFSLLQEVVILFASLLYLQSFHIIVLCILIFCGVNDHTVSRAIDDDNVPHFFEVFKVIHQVMLSWLFFFTPDNFIIYERS
jgi:hypothetical protein